MRPGVSTWGRGTHFCEKVLDPLLSQNQKHSTHTKERMEQIIHQPEPGDVLCGRGKNSFRHMGNHRFRQVILEHASLNKTAETKQRKTQLVLLVAYTIIERGGRFLIRNNKEDGTTSSSWRNGGLKQGKLKAGHAFRDVVRGRFQSLDGRNTTRGGTRDQEPTNKRREGEMEDKKYVRFTQISDTATLEKATPTNSVCLSSPMLLSTVEPLKAWKTATMDPKLAMEVQHLLVANRLLKL